MSRHHGGFSGLSACNLSLTIPTGSLAGKLSLSASSNACSTWRSLVPITTFFLLRFLLGFGLAGVGLIFLSLPYVFLTFAICWYQAPITKKNAVDVSHAAD
jgi:hypothetical protein